MAARGSLTWLGAAQRTAVIVALLRLPVHRPQTLFIDSSNRLVVCRLANRMLPVEIRT